jgi:hypothetical protein
MRLIWLLLALVLVAAAVGGSTQLDNPNARIGLYFLAAAAGLWFVGILIA